jgi:phospholipid-translocating ATPase
MVSCRYGPRSFASFTRFNQSRLQSTIIYFIILYGYFVPTSRSDGYDVSQYEFSTVMVISAVFVANFFNGLETNVWTGWVFFAVALGNVLVLLYTVSKAWKYFSTTIAYARYKAIYNSVSPGWFSTPVFGNNHFLWPSAYFWFGIVLTFFLSLAPRYVYKSYNFIFNPNDFDIMRWAKKIDPHRDFAKVTHTGGQLSRLRPSTRSGVSSAMGSAAPSRSTLDCERPGAPPRTTSRTDMSTGLRSMHRGFDFAAEEGGPAIRRLQSNLSAPRPSQTSLHHGLGDRTKQKISFASLRNPLKRRRPGTISQEGHDRH